MDRKSFLSATALLTLSARNLDAAKMLIKTPAAHDDEEYWKTLKSSLFTLEQDRIYLNNGTMGITPLPVLHAIKTSFENAASKGAYPMHKDTLQQEISKLTGCTPGELAITKNVSEGINLAAWGIKMQKGDEVLMTIHEHAGGSLPWLHRAATDGIVIKTFSLGKTADETLENLKKAVSKKTRVIAVPHIPCTIGQILPVKAICESARQKGIISAIDGAHPLGMIKFDLKDMGCDYYSGCLHKWALGPLGVGFFYVRKDMLNDTTCRHVAAYSSPAFDMSTVPPSYGNLVPDSHRFFYGTFSGPLFDGALEALRLYNNIGPERIEKRALNLAGYLQQSLLDFGNKIIMLTPVEAISRGAQIGFRINNGNPKASQEFNNQMNGKKIALRYVGESNIDCVRVSTHYYNSKEEIDTVMRELKTYLG